MSQQTPASPIEKTGEQHENSTKPTDSKRETGPEREIEAEREIGGPPGPEPTRFGDWEKKGRCIDF